MTKHSIITKLISIISLMLMTMQASWAQSGNWDSYRASGYESGAGTQANPYIIKTAEQLAYFAWRVKAGSDRNASIYVELGDNIDLTAHWWIPIGQISGANPVNVFEGHFDGKGYTISNMYNNWGTAENGGLFSALKGSSTVRNLIIDNAHVINPTGSVGSKRVGVLAGALRNTATIENVIISNSEIKLNSAATLTSSHWVEIGGIAGPMWDSPTVRNCYVDVDIDISLFTHDTTTNRYGESGANNSWYGLALGSIEGSGTLTVDNVFTTGSMKLKTGSTSNYTSTCVGYTKSTVKKNITNYYYINVPEDNSGSDVANTDKTGTQKGADFTTDFVKSANTYADSRNDLETWVLRSGNNHPTFSNISVSLNEVYDHTKTSTSYVLSGFERSEAKSITWTVDGNTITPTAGSNEMSISLPLSQKEQRGTVEIVLEGNTVTKTFVLAPKTYSEDVYADEYESGDGTKENPYIIANDLQLAKLARDVNTGSTGAKFNGRYFELSDDIDLCHAKWLPIGSHDYTTHRYFSGKFDGKGKTIKSMKMYWSDTQNAWSIWGLFASLGGGGTSDAAYCQVRNLIIDGASLEKEADFKPVGSGLNGGILVGEALPYTELGNIIIRNSTITDGGETYTKTNTDYCFGGLAGNVKEDKSVCTYKIFNITAGVTVDMFRNATVTAGRVFLAQVIAQAKIKYDNNAYNIYPTNIYAHGSVTTKDGSQIRVGGVIGNMLSYTIPAAQEATWYYVKAETGNNVWNKGTQKDLADFANTFVLTENNYLQDKGFTDLMTWVYANNQFQFSTLTLTLDRTNGDVVTPDKAGQYHWYVSRDKTNWEPIMNTDGTTPLLSHTLSLPYQEYDQYIYAESEDGTSKSKYITVEALRITATFNSEKNEDDKTTYSVNVTNNIWGTDNSRFQIEYHWRINDGGDVSTESSYTPETELDATHKVFCHVVVKDNTGKVIFERTLQRATVVYLCPAGATGSDGKTYEAGSDDNTTDTTWGYSPEKPMKTWKGAYSKLEKDATWDENYIVLMGKSESTVTNDPNNGFNITINYQGRGVENYNSLTSARWETAKTSPLFRNVTITSKWDDIAYGGEIKIGESEYGLPLWGDTRFENITFGYGGSDYNIIYCQFNNFEMGEGVQMASGFNISPEYGKLDGSRTVSLQIFGGVLNDARYGPINTKEKLQKAEEAMRHGREGFSITLKSGYYSAICSGSRHTNSNQNLEGFMGTPNMPVKCKITIDIDRKFNNEHNNNDCDYDAGIILAGNHEGAMFGDVDIVVKSGNIGRIVNGTLGSLRPFSYSAGGSTQYIPYNTFMGRANITLDPESSTGNNSTDINGRIIVTELYGGSAGRAFDGSGTIQNPFYGYSTVHIKGGTFKLIKGTESEITQGIFGAGAGGMNGIGNDTYHTTDDRIPYWSGTDSVMLFNTYEKAKDALVHYHCYNSDTQTYTDVDPLKTNTKIIIDGGVFGTEEKPIDGIYACGSGYMSKGLWTKDGNKPNKTGGNIYGEEGATVSSLTINGGTFYCKNGIFAGGRGTSYYYSTNPYAGTASDYTSLGQVYGNVELNINGGEFHCPVFGGGYGVADATLKGTSTISTLSDMALIKGKSTVTITGGTFFDNIYGGGDMARIDNGNDDATNLYISDRADIRGSVFAGGNGREARAEGSTTINNDTKSPELVGKVSGNTNVSFYGDSRLAPTIYGDIYGGGNLALVDGSTRVNIYAASFAGQLFGGGKGLLWTDGGPVRNSADISGNTLVTLAKDQGGQEDGTDGEKVDYFSINVIWDKLWDSTDDNFYVWNAATGKDVIVDNTKFFKDKKFVNPHNIYGGGNVACKVGTYDEDGKLKQGTGLATVDVQKGTTPFGLLNTKEWKESFVDNNNPHFYVFGGGQGANTMVGSTDVTVDVEGDYGIYNAEVSDEDEQLSKWNPVDFGSRTGRARSGSVRTQSSTTEETETPVFDNSRGIPNFTILGVLGGGFAGTVKDSTTVTIDGKTFIHRVYGGGFGDPESTTDNETGQVGGSTNVFVKGAHIYGDVFGGGAGVQRKDAEAEPFVNIARVFGTTKVEISDSALVYGKVYGGGDIANVGEEATTPDYTLKPKSQSVLNQANGAFLRYEAAGYKTFVNIVGGDIFGNVFGGGKGAKLSECTQYYKVGRINGNTLVHIANTNTFANYTYDQDRNDIPYVWNRIYGGCAYGTVDGNTLVHIEGGRLGLNVFGGGYGDVKIEGDATDDSKATSTDPNTLAQVLGKKDTGHQGTYADILGNTKVQIDGGSWIWNQWADINGNITTWMGANAANNKICENLDEFKQIVAAISTAKTVDDIQMPKAKAAIEKIKNDKDTEDFFDIETLSFVKNHNIFGGGNRACRVGTYGEDGTTLADTNTGDAIVELNHSPLTDLTDPDHQRISLHDCTTLQGLCWYLGYKSTSHPQFSVFGAGYGANTIVGNAKVYLRPGAMMDKEYNLIDVKGVKYRYLNQVSDMDVSNTKEAECYEDFKGISREDKKLYYGSSTGGNADGTDDDRFTYLRYRASRMAWSLGVSGLTFMEVHGGGFSGYVAGDTYVESDCETHCRNIYGAGLGATPYGTISGDGSSYDFGKVGGNSKVFIKAGYVSQNIYGGGAGVESFSNDNTGNKMVDFQNMALVNGKTEVHIYGEKINHTRSSLIDRTLIFGSIYGGGDVANVGTTEAAAKQFTHDDYENLYDITSLVNIRGGNFFAPVFAGGNGRLKKQCNDYTKLGGIKGNACVIIDRPVMNYPYLDTDASATTTGDYDPSSYANMRHPGDDVNTDLMPAMWNRVYGGCQNGTIYGNTILAVNDGNIAHNVFGGGWGDCDTTVVNNTEVVDMTSADITGNTNMIITGGQMNLVSYWHSDSRTWEPTTVIDGITYSPQYNHETQKFKINHNIYAGGNAACTVKNNTYLTMTKGLLAKDTQIIPGQAVEDFFSSNEWREVYNKVGSPHFCVFGGGFGENTTVDGDAYVTVAMARRGPITGYDIETGKEYKHFISDYSVMDIIGGGYSGKVNGSTHVEGDGGVFCRRIFGGGFYNSVNATNVTLKAIDCHDIFGGGLMGDVLTTTNVQIGVKSDGDDATNGSTNDITNNNSEGFTNKDIYIHGDVYGGNDVSGYVNVTLDQSGFFKDNNGEGTKINIYGGRIDGNVYGAGNGDYLYALDKKGNTNVTVNENYPLNPNDPDSETEPLVYTVPMRNNMPSYKAASDAAKIVNINSWRPMTNKVSINVQGLGADDDKRVKIRGDVYGGGNSATVMKVQMSDARANVTTGDIKINIGSHVNIGRVFMGCNGDALFTASEDNDFMNKFSKLNGDVNDYSKELDLADTIDWMNDPSNKGISTLYLPTKNEDRPTVYPHLLDLYFQPVETDIQGTLTWNGSETGANGLEDCIIGTFCCGGNRGNMNVYPIADDNYISVIPLAETGSDDTDERKIGNVIDYTFPKGLTITDKIVGGCNNANYDYKGKANHEGGYLLGLAKSAYPFIKLTVDCDFQPEEEDNAYVGGNVYGGCYNTGTVRGDITIDLKSDMLKGKNIAKVKESNELISSNSAYSTLNVYGAGYGMESYVYGNTNIKVAEGLTCTMPKKGTDTFEATGTSANFIYGGGQQGNVIGVTNVEVFNGHIYKSVTGGSYAGNVWGSTHVKVGYPKYYEVKLHESGRYSLKRADQENKDIDKNIEEGAELYTETIKQNISLVTGDLVSQAVYDEIDGKYDSSAGSYTPIADADKSKYFEEHNDQPSTETGWDNVNIVIGEAVYGGGYSIAHSISGDGSNTTVLKFNEKYNLDNAFTTNEEHKAELRGLPGGTTAGFGGNTTILIADRTAKPADSSVDRDHITISRQDMKVANVDNGKDLLGFYYQKAEKDADGNATGNYTYHYIYQAGKYYKGGSKDAGTLPSDMVGEDVYEYDNEGGIFGDGHLSYAEGFRCADLTGYGFASTTIQSPKILNTFQRMDVLRLTDNCFSLLGARDYATDATVKTPFSISRVGEIQMMAKDIVTDNDTLTNHETARARNYMGFANNVLYVGALQSNVAFTDTWYNGKGKAEDASKSYLSVKQEFIDNHYNGVGGDTEFEKRNDGTAKNMIGIASGYALKIQNAQQFTNTNLNKIYYGPIYGIIEMNLIDVREDEGGGYVYADNVHKRTAAEGETAHDADFLETTGNFVFPYAPNEGRYVVDDCFPTSFVLNSDNTDAVEEAHYWYVTGFNYHYTAHITGYTSESAQTFFSNNKDGIVALSNLKPGQEVNIISWKTYSAHTNTETEKYDCELEKRNYDTNTSAYNKYVLKVGAFDNTEYKEGEGFEAELSMQEGNSTTNVIKPNIPSTDAYGDAKILFRLDDSANNNPEDDEEYYKKYLSEPCKATLELQAEAKDADGTQMAAKIALSRLYYKEGDKYTEVEQETNLSKDVQYYYRHGETQLYQEVTRFYTKENNSENYTEVNKENVQLGLKDQIYYAAIKRYYTYTIDLTIEYIQGPSISGNITIENCALPGERIRIRKNNVVIKADQAFSVNGYYWRIGKREKGVDGKWRFVGDDKQAWTKENMQTAGYNTFNQTDKEGVGLFKDCYYNTTEDYIEVPAYYYMNGYCVQLGVTMNAPGLDNIFALKILDQDTLTVHNYHRMDPHLSRINLHLPEAIMRAAEFKEAVKNGDTSVQPFAEPRIYLSDQRDLTAFVNFLDTIGTDSKAPRYGANAQFVLLNDLTIADTEHNGATSLTNFAGILHGNGHIINGLKPGNSLLKTVTGQIYNLGLSAGKIANMEPADGRIATYHCCYEYNPSAKKAADDTHNVYRMDGTVDTHYTTDDFRYGRVAYDLNQFYLRARYSNDRENEEDMTALKYVYDYYANGDYQYAQRTNAITEKNTGITYLRTGQDSDLPNYEQAITRHDKTHTIDKARAQNYVAATTDVPESRTGDYLPLLNANMQGDNATPMNDFLFWGQSLQSTPADYPTAITSHETGYMTNRVYRTAGYYGNTKIDAYHYNAYNRDNSNMSTYVHIPATTAIDFTCTNDKGAATGMTSDGIFFPPLKDNATVFHDFIIKDGVTKNLLVYTDANSSDEDNKTEAFDVVKTSLAYDATTKESLINGHHITLGGTDDNTFSTALFHLVERDANGKNSEGDLCNNNDLCVPIAFNVSDHAWYTRQPMYYANDNTGAWEGVCLPFTVDKAVASLNGEITHFYGTPDTDENADPATNTHTLHHEYWLRGLTSVKADGSTTTATYLRPGAAGSDLFAPVDNSGNSLAMSKRYHFDNSFFVDTYENKLYNKDSNPYYNEAHDYEDYQLLTANIPYIVRFPGERYYEFDLSSKFYRSILNRSATAQSVTYNAYGIDNLNWSGTNVTIPVTDIMSTTVNGYSHQGTYAATAAKAETVYGMNSSGTAFDDASSVKIMPFRTFMSPVAKASAARRGSVIYIAEASGIDRIVPEMEGGSSDGQSPSDLFRVIPVGDHKVRIESSRAMTLNVVTTTGQLYRILDVRPGSAVYSGFLPGIYLFGNMRVMVQK